MMIGSIPSPPGGSLQLGPLEFRAYGLMIALGALVAVWWSQKRWKTRGGAIEDISVVALWAIPSGLVGSRLYHVATEWRSFRGRWEDAVAIWEGGLGIPGGLVVGVLVGMLVARRRKLDVTAVLDTMIPTIPVAQAIGRWGNWFNQELFGRPSELWWALEIDPLYRPVDHSGEATFHPTFLYESLWNLALAALLVRVERSGALRPGRVVGLWILGYGLGRLWVETLRIDHASLITGVRVNIWMSLMAVIVGAVVTLTGRQAPQTN